MLSNVQQIIYLLT